MLCTTLTSRLVFSPFLPLRVFVLAVFLMCRISLIRSTSFIQAVTRCQWGKAKGNCCDGQWRRSRLVSKTRPAHTHVFCVSAKSILVAQANADDLAEPPACFFTQKEEITKEFVLVLFAHLQGLKIFAAGTPESIKVCSEWHVPFEQRQTSALQLFQKSTAVLSFIPSITNTTRALRPSFQPALGTEIALFTYAAISFSNIICLMFPGTCTFKRRNPSHTQIL